jgi:acylphosphatase
MERLEVRFIGHVQGVGFRYTTQRISTRWRVTGYVENRQDGSVFLAAEGERQELEKFLDQINAELEPNILKAEIHWYAASGEWSAFNVRR